MLHKLPLPVQKKGLPTAAIIGVALGGSFFFALVMMAIHWWFLRRRHQRKLEAIKTKYEAEVAAVAAAKKETPDRADDPRTSPTEESETGTGILPKAELPGIPTLHYDLGTDNIENESTTLTEVNTTEQYVFEMPGCIPERQEAGGRQLSEKESMVVRERIYNGVGPNTPAASLTTKDVRQRLAPTSLSEVHLIDGRMPRNTNVLLVSLRTPRDGAFFEIADTFFQLPPYQAR
jgi:hypothetical protein